MGVLVWGRCRLTIWDDLAFLQAEVGLVGEGEGNDDLIESTHALRMLLLVMASSLKTSWEFPRCGVAVHIWSIRGSNINKSLARAML